MKTTPLRWWSGAALAEAASAIAPAWQRWCAGWDVTPGAVVASNACDLAESEQPRHWQRCGGTMAAWLGYTHADPGDALRAMLFAASQGEASSCGSLAQEVAEAAWRDLAQELGCSLQGHETAARSRVDAPESDPAPPEAGWRPWSGAVNLQLDTSQADVRPLWLHLAAPSAELLLGGQTPASAIDARFAAKDLGQLGNAIGRNVVRLRVELDGLALDFGTLQTLRPGDVLSLQHRLDEPLHVCLPRDAVAGGGGSALCSALLGARGRRRAVELVRGDTSA